MIQKDMVTRFLGVAIFSVAIALFALPQKAYAASTPPCYINGQVAIGNGIGDVNGDGQITSVDSLLVLRHVAGFTDAQWTNGAQTRGDVDGDGQITAVDALFIQRYIANMDKTFKVCSQIFTVSPDITSPITMSLSSYKPMIFIEALLKDGNGVIVADQTDFAYTWTTDKPFANISGNGPYCIAGVQPPCPNASVTVAPYAVGTYHVMATVTQKSTGKNIGTATFTFVITK